MSFGPGEIDPSQSLGGGAPARSAPAPANQVTFSRRELKRILPICASRFAPATCSATTWPPSGMAGLSPWS